VSPYKDKVLQRKAVKRAVQKHRGITETEQGITHPILYDLIDPIRRRKLEAICESFKARGLGGMVYYGLREPIDFLTIGDLLQATA